MMLTVKDVMAVAPRTVSPDTLLSAVQALMLAHGCRQLPVVDEQHLVGIITEYDVTSVGDAALLKVFSAETMMTPSPITVSPQTPVYRAAELLNAYGFDALPVVDGARLVGMVSVANLLDYFSPKTKER